MGVFAYLKKFKLALLVVIVFLAGQALCELILPTYTANIVDIGIQHGGIENSVPVKIRESSLENLKLIMTDNEIASVESSYNKNGEGIYELIKNDKENTEVLDKSFTLPMAMLTMAENNPEFDVNKIKMALKNNMMTKDQVIEMRDKISGSLGDLAESVMQQQAVNFVKSEYKEIGMDTDAMQTDYLIKIGIRMIIMTILAAVASILAGFIASNTAAKIGMNLRSRVFEKIVSFSNAEMDKFSSASLITRSTNDIQQIQQAVVMLLRIVFYAPLLGIGGIIRVSQTKTGLDWIIVVSVLAICVVIGILYMVVMPKFKMMQTLVDKLNLVSREILTGIPVIRIFNRQKHEEKRFDEANKDLTATQLFTNRAMTFMMPLMMLIMNIITVMIIWFGAKGIDMGNLQVGGLMAFITYTMQIVMAFMMFTMISILLPRANVSAGRVNEVLNTDSTILDKPKLLDEKLGNEAGIIEFHNVSFHYPGAEKEVLKEINLKILPKQTTAIIGGTGSGKSTLLHLLLRFYDASKGKITIDGIDIRDISQEKLRSLLGFVPQKTILFSGDVTTNLKFAGDNISDETMKEAAEIAQAAEFIESKAEKYNFKISQGGSNVSGGQRQRLAIGRALAKKSPVIMFDDSFSALDYRTEMSLRQELSKAMADTTVIIVTQRVATVMDADQIVVLDKRRVAGVGTHKELLENCEVYHEIATSQLSNEELGIEEKEGV